MCAYRHNLSLSHTHLCKCAHELHQTQFTVIWLHLLENGRKEKKAQFCHRVSTTSKIHSSQHNHNRVKCNGAVFFRVLYTEFKTQCHINTCTAFFPKQGAPCWNNMAAPWTCQRLYMEIWGLWLFLSHHFLTYLFLWSNVLLKSDLTHSGFHAKVIIFLLLVLADHALEHADGLGEGDQQPLASKRRM